MKLQEIQHLGAWFSVSKLRPLGIEDVFALSEILDKLQIVDNIADIQQKAVGKEDAASYAGVQIMALVLSKMYRVKDLMFAWLADLTNQTVQDISKLSLKELKELFTQISKSDGITELFTSLVSTEEN